MPHIAVKMFPGRTPEAKTQLAEALTKAMMDVLQTPESAISVGVEDVAPEAWNEAVAKPEIVGKMDTIFKKPGYDLPKA